MNQITLLMAQQVEIHQLKKIMYSSCIDLITPAIKLTIQITKKKFTLRKKYAKDIVDHVKLNMVQQTNKKRYHEWQFRKKAHQ